MSSGSLGAPRRPGGTGGWPVAGRGAGDRDGAGRRRLTKPVIPSGRKRITSISVSPTAARPATAVWPPVAPYINTVTSDAPTAGPIQCRAPPITLIRTT